MNREEKPASGRDDGDGENSTVSSRRPDVGTVSHANGRVQRLDAVVSGARPPGLYRWLSRAHPAAIRRELAAAGWDLHRLDGSRINTATDLFDACAETLQFPAYFGFNWDALADCLGDLSWLPERGRVLLWDRYGVLAAADPDAWAAARSVFADVAAERAERGAAPLYTLLRGDGPADGIPLL